MILDKTFLQPCEDWKKQVLTFINGQTVPPKPQDIVSLLDYRNELQVTLNSLKASVFTPPTIDIASQVNEKYNNLEAQQEQQRQAVLQEAEQIKQQRTLEVQQYNTEVQNYNEHLTDDIEKEHRQLQKYKKQLDDVFKHYNITPLSMELADDISEADFKKMLDASIGICQKYAARTYNTFLDKQLRALKKEDGIHAITKLGIAAIAVFILTPVIGVYYYMQTIRNTMTVADDVEALKLARALMAEVSYSRFITADQFKQKQDAPDFTDVDAEVETRLSEFQSYDEARNQELSQAEEMQQLYAQATEEARSAIRTRLNDIISDYEKMLTEVQKNIDDFLADYHPFPTAYKTSAVLSHEFVFGRINDTLDVTLNVPLRNIVFKYETPDQYQLAINRCKLYLSNIILNVQPKKLDVTISDPLHQGSDFAEFLIPECKDYFKVVDTDFTVSITDVRKVTLDNIAKLDNMDIDTFNKQAEEKGIVTLPYKLLIIASGIQHDEKGTTKDYNDKMKAYFAESVKHGVLIWIIDTASYVGTIEDKIQSTQLHKGVPIEYTVELGKQAVNTFARGLSEYKTKALDYTAGFANKYIPRDKWWTWDTVKGIELNFGLENGDPSRGFPITLGDANVHALMGGATGAGKSAAINQMLISLITKYPPSELQIIYIDFKNVEAAKFTRGVHEDGSYMTSDEMTELMDKEIYFKRVSIIPHVTVISGTTDGAYALSLFKALNKEMQNRQAIINKYGFTKIQNVREMVLDKYKESHGGKKVSWHEMRQDWEWYKPNVLDQGLEIPRLLVICDEFQVMFNDKVVPPKIIDEITGLITLVTKLARAMCCHLWFTSQSMKGTISNDTKSNFSLRAALRCTTDVSTELLGNDAAGTIKDKFGYMYTNDSAGQDKGANKFWRVPFLSDDEIISYVEQTNTMLEANHEKAHEAYFFDDKQLIPMSVIDVWYKEYPESFESPTTFILGERADYSTNTAPVTMILSKDVNENVLVSGFNKEDVLNNTLTLIHNLQKKENVTTIISVADTNAYQLMAPEEYLIDAVKPLCSPKQDFSELIETINGMIQARLDAGTTDAQPIFVFLLFWEVSGMFSGGNYKMEDKMKEMFRNGPSVNIYFILAISAKMDCGSWIPKCCAHRIAAQNSKDTFFFCETTQVEKLPSNKSDGNFAYYELGTKLSKFKIYQHKFKGAIMEREVII